jgi:hypothetical protein
MRHDGLGPELWEGTLRTAWARLRDRVEVAGDLQFNHEHTLQFHLASSEA